MRGGSGRVGDGEAGGDVDGWPRWWKRLTPHLGVHASCININDALEALATGRVDGKAVRSHGDRSPAAATDVSRRSPSGLV